MFYISKIVHVFTKQTNMYIVLIVISIGSCGNLFGSIFHAILQTENFRYCVVYGNPTEETRTTCFPLHINVHVFCILNTEVHGLASVGVFIRNFDFYN